MAITSDRKLSKLNNDTFFCNFEEFDENIELEIRMMKDMLYIQYCDHINFLYDYKDPDSIPIDIYLKSKDKLSPLRREIRNIREIIDYEENKNLLAGNYDMVNKAVQKLEKLFGINDTNTDNHYYDFVFDENTRKPIKTNFEIIRRNNSYIVITPELIEKKLNSDELALFLVENKVNQLTDYAKNPIDIKYLFEDKLSKSDDMKRVVV
jgi:hypothetical protein